MLMAPMSCNISSAAMVSALIRDSANATSSFRLLHFKEMHTMTFNNNHWFRVGACPSSLYVALSEGWTLTLGLEKLKKIINSTLAIYALGIYYGIIKYNVMIINILIKMVTDHQHVQVLVNSVDCKWSGGICRRWNHICL